jgi:hypothetical protein
MAIAARISRFTVVTAPRNVTLSSERTGQSRLAAAPVIGKPRRTASWK